MKFLIYLKEYRVNGHIDLNRLSNAEYNIHHTLYIYSETKDCCITFADWMNNPLAHAHPAIIGKHRQVNL